MRQRCTLFLYDGVKSSLSNTVSNIVHNTFAIFLTLCARWAQHCQQQFVRVILCRTKHIFEFCSHFAQHCKPQVADYYIQYSAQHFCITMICVTLDNNACKVERIIVDIGLHNIVFNVLQTLHNIVINSLYNVACNVTHCEFCSHFAQHCKPQVAHYYVQYSIQHLCDTK